MGGGGLRGGKRVLLLEGKREVPLVHVGTLTFCQPMGFPLHPLKVKLLAGEQKALVFYFLKGKWTYAKWRLK